MATLTVTALEAPPLVGTGHYAHLRRAKLHIEDYKWSRMLRLQEAEGVRRQIRFAEPGTEPHRSAVNALRAVQRRMRDLREISREVIRAEAMQRVLKDEPSPSDLDEAASIMPRVA